MENFFNRHSHLGPAIIRIGLAIVYLWFGYHLVSNPSGWASQVPDYATKFSPFSTQTIILLNGIFEIVLGVALLLGFWTRIAAFLLAIHLIPIFVNLGYGAIAIRDFGIFMATLGLSFIKPDHYTIDRKKNP